MGERAERERSRGELDNGGGPSSYVSAQAAAIPMALTYVRNGSAAKSPRISTRRTSIEPRRTVRPQHAARNVAAASSEFPAPCSCRLIRRDVFSLPRRSLGPLPKPIFRVPNPRHARNIYYPARTRASLQLSQNCPKKKLPSGTYRILVSSRQPFHGARLEHLLLDFG